MKYDIVLADPPWSYKGQQDRWGAAAKFYSTMPDADLLVFPMRDFMADRSILFLWATSPRLDFAMDCIRAWNLAYRGVAFVWVKTTKAGVPIRAQGVRPSIVKPLTEYVLSASTVSAGRPLSLSDESVCQTVFAPRTEHSRKPNEVQERIEALYPTAKRIELFARRKRKGWKAWGDQIAPSPPPAAETGPGATYLREYGFEVDFIWMDWQGNERICEHGHRRFPCDGPRCYECEARRSSAGGRGVNGDE